METEWHPARLLHADAKDGPNQFALLVLNQPIENLAMLKLVWKKAFFHIAADGGANRLRDAARDEDTAKMFRDQRLEAVCGDLDSIDLTVEVDLCIQGTDIDRVRDQDTTDFEKSITYLRTKVFPIPDCASNIICLGGLGGRLDHGISQLHQLYKAQTSQAYQNSRVYLLSSENLTFVLKTGHHRIQVKDPQIPHVLGTHVGIIPINGPSILTTQGLEWDVTDWRTEFGGQMSTSNRVREEWVGLWTTADVLFTIEVIFRRPLGFRDR